MTYIYYVFAFLLLYQLSVHGDRCAEDDVSSQLVHQLTSAIEEADYLLGDPSQYPPHYAPQPGDRFDFIVVGAGSAGSAIASRLSEVKEWSVLLVEAGGDPTKTSDVPGLHHRLQGTSIDWRYHTDAEGDNCLGMVNNTCKYPRGKVLGGSSTINANLYVRGHPWDYDERWEREGQCPGWGFEDVLPYFKKSEDLRAREVLKEGDYETYHSKGGDLTVSTFDNSDLQDLIDAYANGVHELGYNILAEPNGATHTGFTPLQGTLRDNKRCNAAKAFLSPARFRKNLKVAKHSLVKKVLIDKKSMTAYGIELLDAKGESVVVKADKEVVVSAGAVNSPQLLMLSGVGPKAHLESLGIEVLKDLKVGENMQDHMLMTGVLLTFNYSKPAESDVEGMFDYLVKSSGPLTNVGLLSSSFFIDTGERDDYPELQFHQVNVPANTPEGVKFLTQSSYNMREEIAKSYVEANKDRTIVLTMPTLMRPKSRGRVSLLSADPKEAPKIVSGFLTHEDDFQVYLKGIDFVQKLVETRPMKALDAKLHRVDIPACGQLAFPSEQYWRCALKHLVSTCFHPTCTCKMGPAADPAAVVSPRLQVHGVQGLRVGDASIMPYIVSGNTNAPSIMIGEKAADIIKQDWNVL